MTRESRVPARPLTKAAVETIAFEGELVAYDPDTGRLHRFDRIASLIWRCLDGNDTVDEIVTDLAEGFGVDRARVETDVLGFIEDLAQEGLLEDAPHQGMAASARPAEGNGPRTAHDGRVPLLTDPPSP